MGLRVEYIDFILNNIGSSKKMCELGNQHIKNKIFDYTTGKEFFADLGFDHTSIDWNGEDGAIIVDLSVPIQDKNLLYSFDILTNIGTSEHVDDQYICFRNIHNLVRKNGYIVHVVPMVGYWKKHCDYHYTFEFFIRLSYANNYSIIKDQVFTNRKGDKLVGVVLYKQQDTEFMNKNEFYKIMREETDYE